MPAKSASPGKESDYIGLRSAELRKKVKDIVDANPGKITISELVRAAIEEKLERLARGEDSGIRLTPPGPLSGPPVGQLADKLSRHDGVNTAANRARKSK